MVNTSGNGYVTWGGIIAIFVPLAIAAAIFVQASGAFANGTMARIAAGGIEFLKSEDIRMLEGVLEISEKKIRVKFRFLNESDKDIHTAVAFPLQPYDATALAEIPGRYEQFEGFFRVRVNGRPTPTTTARKALIGGRDVTQRLRDLGLSDEQIFAFCHTIPWYSKCDLTKNQEAGLEILGGEKRQLALWQVAGAIFWQQTFPAGKEIVVEHEYIPAAGGVYHPICGLEIDLSTFDFISARYGSDACLDEPTARALQNGIKAYSAKTHQMGYITLKDVEYILSTSRNWKGPIGEFTLTIKKETPDQIVSLCFPGKPRKVSPTEYEFYQKEFVPPDKLVVHFFSVGPSVQ